MAKRYRPADISVIIGELCNVNDRARAIVGGSLLDGLLDYAITMRLMPLTLGEESMLFKPGGPFASCDQKIQAAYALGLFGPLTKGDMKCLNEVRNVFAHNMNPVTFDDPEIVEMCVNLRTGSGVDKTMSTRDRFVFAFQWILDGLLDDANDFPENKLKPISRHLSD